MGQELITKCLPNIGQIPYQEGKVWGVESVIVDLQREPVNPKEGGIHAT